MQSQATPAAADEKKETMITTEPHRHSAETDLERHLPIEDAIALAQSWANEMDLELTSKTVIRSELTGATTTRTALSTPQGTILGEGSGKGIGRQAIASGLFEAIEHAAMNFKIPGQVDPLLQRQLLPDYRVENLDRAYTVARKLRLNSPQDVLIFHEIDTDLNPIQDSFCTYPRIACDLSAPISPDCGPLIALSAYSASTGTSAGTNWRDSVLHGLNEVIERDAQSQFLVDIHMGRRSYSTIRLNDTDPLQKLFLELTRDRNRSGAIYMLNSMSGYVFCAVSEPTTDEGELGFGASQHPRIALERALTELQQAQNAVDRGTTWKDEGGDGLESLEDRPNMRRIASLVFPIDEDFDIQFEDIETPVGPLPSPVDQLRKNGFTPFVREVWRSYIGNKQIVVTQSIVPGLESLCNLVFGRRILPSGRLLSSEIVEFLQQE